MWKLVEDKNVLSFWECEHCHSKISVTADYYELVGVPVCCGRDMLYGYTEVYLDNANPNC